MTEHPRSERLSAYLDGDLAAGERALLERHLAGCAQCRDELAGLERVRAWLAADTVAAADEPSPSELAAIQARIAGEVVPLRPRPVSWRWVIPAGIAAAAVVAGVMATRPDAAPRALPPVRVAAAASPYDGAAAELEAALRRDGTRLDPKAARALARTLESIDRAIAEARRARAADPGNEFVARHLERLRGERMATLRDALAAAQS